MQNKTETKPGRGAATSSKQRTAITLLAAGRAVIETARACGVSRATVYRWFDDAAFQAELATERARVISEIGGATATVALKAVRFIELVIDDETAKREIRLRAAIAMLSSCPAVLERVDLAARVGELEAYYGNQTKN